MEHDDHDDQVGPESGTTGGGPSRRTVLMAGAGALASAALAACARGSETAGTGATTASTTASAPTTAATAGGATATTLAPTPECVDADDVTPTQTEGPFFTPNSPERSDLRSGVAGTRLVLSGAVVTTACKPVARALVDLWQAVRGDHPLLEGTGEGGESVLGQPESAVTLPCEGHVQAGTVVLGPVGGEDLAGRPAQPRPRRRRVADAAQEVPAERQVPVRPGHQALHVGQVEGPGGGRGHRRRSHRRVPSASREVKSSSRIELWLSTTVMLSLG